MRWLNKHARNRLSPYIDGALPDREQNAVEAHLATCEACRSELEELRATVAALRGAPRAEAPRSFALTPAMLERRGGAAAAPSVPPLALGMRLASAGVAVVLAVVVVGDITGGVEDGTREASDQGAMESRTTEDLAADRSGEGAAGQAASPATGADAPPTGYEAPATEEDRQLGAQDGSATCSPGNAAAVPAAPTAGSGGAGGPMTYGETPAASPAPQPSPTPTPGASVDMLAGCQPVAGGVAPVTSAAEPQRDGAAQGGAAESGNEAGGDGVLTLRAIEIALAALLVVLLVGMGAEMTMRMRRAV